ncbi:MAG: hypothetical protein K8F30_08870 [Taibaiella sp.]|nr:hypothetical protein [Taibaiella sp.]
MFILVNGIYSKMSFKGLAICIVTLCVISQVVFPYNCTNYVIDHDIEISFTQLSLPIGDIRLTEGMVYVANHWDGVKIYSLDSLAIPILVNTSYVSEYAQAVNVVGNRMYVAGYFEFHCVDISNSDSLFELGSLMFESGWTRSIKVENDIAYLASFFQGLRIVDVSDPYSMQLLSTVDTPSDAMESVYSDGIVYVAGYSGGVHIVDVSDPSAPEMLSTIDIPGFTWDVCLVGSRLYIPIQQTGLMVVEVSDPSNPVIESIVDMPHAFSVEYLNDVLYLLDPNDGISAFRLSDNGEPILIAVAEVPVGYGGFVATSNLLVTETHSGNGYGFHVYKPNCDPSVENLAIRISGLDCFLFWSGVIGSAYYIHRLLNPYQDPSAETLIGTTPLQHFQDLGALRCGEAFYKVLVETE